MLCWYPKTHHMLWRLGWLCIARIKSAGCTVQSRSPCLLRNLARRVTQDGTYPVGQCSHGASGALQILACTLPHLLADMQYLLAAGLPVWQPSHNEWQRKWNLPCCLQARPFRACLLSLMPAERAVNYWGCAHAENASTC